MKLHPLDHLVLPCASLDEARARLTALGFTVSPRGEHPFGTINCCVYFSDGTFIEPLAIGDADKAEQAAKEGNVFVERDKLFRSRNGDNGFSALVLGTEDADADHARFVKAGVSAGEILFFSRDFVDASGAKDKASFKLAFAADEKSQDAFAFACQRVNVPKVDKSELERHGNGVMRIKGVVAVSATPEKSSEFLTVAAGGQKFAANTTLLPNTELTVLNAEAFFERYGVASPKSDELVFSAIRFGVADMNATHTLLARNGVDNHKATDFILVPSAPGQGAHIIFEENK
ncbi:VOC family protein [Mesorhizobium sp. SB112]|uniref:VOC family protein n=1 Tax=Mesorhizobium sp. SB112 TaxID=3151853 RepID=UPI003267CE7B